MLSALQEALQGGLVGAPAPAHSDPDPAVPSPDHCAHHAQVAKHRQLRSADLRAWAEWYSTGGTVTPRHSPRTPYCTSRTNGWGGLGHSFARDLRMHSHRFVTLHLTASLPTTPPPRKRFWVSLSPDGHSALPSRVCHRDARLLCCGKGPTSACHAEAEWTPWFSKGGGGSLQKVKWLKVSEQGKSQEGLRFRSGNTWSTTSQSRAYLQGRHNGT